MTKQEFIDQVAGQDRPVEEGRDGGGRGRARHDSPKRCSPAATSTSPASASSTSPSAATARASTRGRASGSRSRAARCRGSPPARRSSRPSRAASAAGIHRDRARPDAAVPRSVTPAPFFGDRLADGGSRAARARCCWASIPIRRELLPQAPAACRASDSAGRAGRGRACRAHCGALVEAVARACVGVKLQLACFERLGAPGWRGAGRRSPPTPARPACWWSRTASGATSRTRPPPTRRRCSARPRRRGGRSPAWAPTRSRPTRCSGATRSSRSSRPRGARGAGVFVLVRTSNPGAAEIQDDAPGGGQPLRERLADDGATSWARTASATGGLSDVGAVVAATEPALMADAARADAARRVPAAGRRRAGRPGRGRSRPRSPAGRAAALVTASRSIADAALEAGDAAAARPAAERLRDAAWAASRG